MGKPPCCEKVGLKKGPWTAEEDQKLIDYIQKHGHGRWRTLPKNAGLKRCGKSCRLRWTNYLRPDIKRGKFSIDEEETIIQLHSVLGNKWSAIAARLPGRTDNEIKNYWNTHIKKKLLRMGIDPITHSPRLDLIELSSLLSSSLYNSSQINQTSLLGNVGPMFNPNFLNLATAFLSSQKKTLDINPVNNNQTGDGSDFPTPSNQYDQSLQENLTHFSSNPNSYQNIDLPSLWQQEYDKNYYGYPESNQPIINSLAEKFQACFSENNIPNFTGYGSFLSTPSSSSTQLKSSSTKYDVNNNGSCSATTEDIERDSYCSNMLMFDLPHGLNVNGYI